MLTSVPILLRSLVVFYLSLSASVSAADEYVLPAANSQRRGYRKGDLVPVSCLNRTIDTGEHVEDSHGNLQYIPFPTCNETNKPLTFVYGVPQTQICTIDPLPDELYHLFEFFVHNDAPLTCRIPSHPLFPNTAAVQDSGGLGSGAAGKNLWTQLTIALQGTLQLSHLHIHTSMNVLLHTSASIKGSAEEQSAHLIGATAYSLPNASTGAPLDGTKIIRNEPLILTFNVGWIDGAVLPGMVGRPVFGVKDHNIGFSLLSFFALAASGGVGAMGMLVYERRKSGRNMNGILGGNTGGPPAVFRNTGYGGYISGKRD